MHSEKRHWDPARIWTWVFWILVRCSCQLSHWSSGIGAEDRWYLSIDTFRISGWISQALLCNAIHPLLQWLSWQERMTRIQKTQVRILAGSQCLFFRYQITLQMQHSFTRHVCSSVCRGGEGNLREFPSSTLCHNESLHVIVITKWLLTSGPSNCTLLPPLFLLCRINPTECSQIAFRGGVCPRSPSDPRFTSHCFYPQIQSRLKTSNQSVPITLQARILLPSLPHWESLPSKQVWLCKPEFY